MKSLSDLQSVLGGLQGQIGGLQDHLNECVNYIAQLTGTTPRKPPARKANGVSLRERVKQHYVTRRNLEDQLDLVMRVEKDAKRAARESSHITITEAAKLLKMSEAGVRFKVANGTLTAMQEMRATRKRGVGSQPHQVLVVDRAEVEALSGTIRRGVGRRPAKKAKRGARASEIQHQRELSMAFLSQFDRTDPRTIPDRRLGALIRRGYLARKGNGYIRTAKEFTLKKGAKPTGPPPRKATRKPARRKANSGWSAEAKARRQQTAELLAFFDTDEPRHLTDRPHRVGVLVQHGYLKAKNGGHVRTAKPFNP